MAYDHKVILTDIDGVVFDWHTQFVQWMEMQQIMEIQFLLN